MHYVTRSLFEALSFFSPTQCGDGEYTLTLAGHEWNITVEQLVPALKELEIH